MNVPEFIDPFLIKAPKITDGHIELLKEWATIHDAAIYITIPTMIKNQKNSSVIMPIYYDVVSSLYHIKRTISYGSVYPNNVPESIAYDAIHAYVGSLFKDVPEWENGYPYQSVADLWEQGLVPSCDPIRGDYPYRYRREWRLHGGPNGKILWKLIYDHDCKILLESKAG